MATQWARRLGRRLRLLLRRGAIERRMAHEFEDHLAREIADRVERGMTPDEARRTALHDFGGVEAVKEHARDARGVRVIEDLAADVRHGGRLLASRPTYTATVILTIGIAMSATAAIGAVAYGILGRPLPYAAPDRLVAVYEHDLQHGRDRNVASIDAYDTWRDRAESFDAMGAIVPASVTLAGGPSADRLVGAEVTPHFFSMLGVAPMLGRDFTDADVSSHCVILSGALWQARFHSDSAIVGSAIRLSGVPYTVVGVMPPDFVAPKFNWLDEQALWFPTATAPDHRAWGRFLLVIARLRDHVTRAQAAGELAAVSARRAAESPAEASWSASVFPLTDEITGDVRTPLLALLAAVALLLVMALSNVATLTLALQTRRADELAMRRALGASDARIFRQLLTQYTLAGGLGAAAGLLATTPALHLLIAWLPDSTPRLASVRIDAPVWIAVSTIAVAATCALAAGVAALARRRESVVTLRMHDANRRVTARSAGGSLVALEIAVALALAVMAVLTVRSFDALRTVPLGFSSDDVITARVALPDASYPTGAEQRQFFAALVDRVHAVPGIRAAGVINGVPLSGSGPATTVRDAEAATDPSRVDPVADVRTIDAGAATAFGFSLQRGTSIGENLTGEAEVVVTSSLARLLWPDRDPIGRHLALNMYDHLTARVVGVVGDVRLLTPRTPSRPAAFLSAQRFPSQVRDLVVRFDPVRTDPDRVVSDLRGTLRSLDPSLPLYAATSMSRRLEGALSSDRATAALLTAFAAAALLLATVGVFGVFAGETASRRKEIGIRLALGARPASIVVGLAGHAAVRIVVGLFAGGIVAAVIARSMRALLYELSPFDPMTFASAASLVAVLAIAATIVPAWRALGASPLRSLRDE